MMKFPKFHLSSRHKWKLKVWFGEFVIKIFRIILPPFHPLKYKWIEYWYGEQSENVWNSCHKFCFKSENEKKKTKNLER
jgi:hypothetical protein